jgi:hypothetical protein
MPHAKQLAFKLIADPCHFDLDTWLRLKDPELHAPGRVTMQEVRGWVSRLKSTY